MQTPIESLVIDSSNYRYIKAYSENVRALNRIIKDGFPKAVREHLSVSDVIPNLHVEVDMIDQKLIEFLRRNKPDFKAGQFYKIIPDKKSSSYSDLHTTYVHIISVSPKNFKIDYEQIEILSDDTSSRYISIGGCLAEDKSSLKNITSKHFADLIYSGRMKEISKNLWDSVYIKYKNMLASRNELIEYHGEEV